MTGFCNITNKTKMYTGYLIFSVPVEMSSKRKTVQIRSNKKKVLVHFLLNNAIELLQLSSAVLNIFEIKPETLNFIIIQTTESLCFLLDVQL